MQEGSPSDPAPSSAEAAVTSEPTEAQAEEVTTAERTPEEIEAIWKNRIAGKDRAHAAETQTLRQQLEEQKTRLSTLEQQKSKQNESEMSEAERWRAKAEEADRRVDQIEKQRVIDLRSVKYAAAAEALDESVLASMDEAKLAALNARLTGDETPPPPVIDPNTPRRTSGTSPAAPRERSVDELESDLRKFEPAFEASLRE